MTEHLTRRELIERAGLAGLVLALPGSAAAFARGAAAAPLAGIDPNKLGKTLTISNWPLYIDVDEKTKKRPTIEQYQRRYHVHVKYIEDINSSAAFFGKIQAPLARGQSIGRDIVVLTDNSPYPALMIQKGWVEKLDKSVLPNIKNLQPGQRHPSWDRNRDFSLPWQSGMTGIGYNAKLTKPITTIDQLFTDRRLKGKVTLLDGIGDTLGLVVLSNGDDPAKIDDAAFNRAVNKIQKALKSGQIRQFTGNDYSGMMAKGDIIAAVVWSGDMVQLQADNPNLRFSLPKEGGMIWTDNMLIPKHGNAYGASVFMNFVYDPVIAAQIEAYVNYVCPVAGADKVLLKRDPKIARNTLIFPTKAMRAKLHEFDPNALFNPDYKTKWQRLLGA